MQYMRSKVVLAACCISGLFLPACVTEHPGTGTINVSHPQVDTRERLLNRRLEEQQWLESQLKIDGDFRLSGSIDEREFIGFAASVKGNFDPLGAAGSLAAGQALNQNSQLTDLQNNLQAAILRKELGQVQDSTNIFNLVAMPTNGVATAGVPITNLLAPSPVTVNVGAFASNNLPALPNPGNITTTKSQLTTIQTLDDQLAKRNYIQALLREQELDDTHDLGGRTIYTLKFDLSVSPGKNNPSFGQVSIGIDNSTASPSLQTFNEWVKAFGDQLRDECLSLEERQYMGFSSPQQQAAIISENGSLLPCKWAFQCPPDSAGQNRRCGNSRV